MSNSRFSIIPSRAATDDRLTPALLKTLVQLGCYGDKDGWCWPSQGTLGGDQGKTQQAVSKCLQKLKALGYIEVRARFNPDGGRTSNMYRILFDTPIQPQEAVPPTTSIGLYPPQPLKGCSNVPINAPINDSGVPEKQDEKTSAEDQQPIEAEDERPVKSGEVSPDKLWPKPVRLENAPHSAEEAKRRIREALERGQRKHAGKPLAVQDSDMTGIPEDLRDLAEAFIAGYQRGPATSELGFWIKEWRNQREIGLSPEDIKNGFKKMRESKLSISSPKSVTAIAWEAHCDRSSSGGQSIDGVREIEFQGKIIRVPANVRKFLVGGVDILAPNQD